MLHPCSIIFKQQAHDKPSRIHSLSHHHSWWPVQTLLDPILTPSSHLFPSVPQLIHLPVLLAQPWLSELFSTVSDDSPVYSSPPSFLPPSVSLSLSKATQAEAFWARTGFLQHSLQNVSHCALAFPQSVEHFDVIWLNSLWCEETNFDLIHCHTNRDNSV